MRDTQLWHAALDAKYFTNPPQPITRTFWDSVLGHYGAVCDVPAVAFSGDLIATYPEAKVVLVEREIEAWYKSFDEAVIPHVFSPVIWAVARIDPFFVRPLEKIHQHWARGWFRADSREEMRGNARGVFREHYEMVTPKERLLVFKLSEGWGPLCEFLGKEVPDVEFLRVNDTDAMTEKMRLVAWRGVKDSARRAVTFLGPVLILGIAWWHLGLGN
jgi:hypothetical protein